MPIFLLEIFLLLAKFTFLIDDLSFICAMGSEKDGLSLRIARRFDIPILLFMIRNFNSPLILYKVLAKFLR